MCMKLKAAVSPAHVFVAVYQQWDWTSIADADRHAELDDLKVGCQVIHTPSQRWSCDVVPNIQRHK